MKKLMTAMAVCAVAGFSLAQGVSSVNVVGYNSVPLYHGYNMIAVNFGPAGNAGGTIDINTLLPTGQVAVVAAGLTGKASPTGADGVLVWNSASGTYSNYFLFKALSANAKNYQWCYVDAGSTYPLATCPFSTGDGLWFNLVGTNYTTITTAGEVPNDVSKTKTLYQGYNQLASGFAAAWDINAIGTNFWAGANFTGKASPTGADGLLIWNASSGSYSNYFLFKALSANVKNYQWCYVDAGSTYPVMTTLIPMTSAVWFNKAKAGTCSFAPQIPYNLSTP